MTRLRQLACDVWILAKGYWRSEERWSARVLLTSIIGLNLGLVGVNVLQKQANGALFTALQHLIEINAQHRDHEVEQDQHDDDDKGAIEAGSVPLRQPGSTDLRGRPPL